MPYVHVVLIPERSMSCRRVLRCLLLDHHHGTSLVEGFGVEYGMMGWGGTLQSIELHKPRSPRTTVSRGFGVCNDRGFAWCSDAIV